MPKSKPLFFNLCLLLILMGVASCSPGAHFDYRTSRQPEVYAKSVSQESAVSLTAHAGAGKIASGEGDGPGQHATDLVSKTAFAAAGKHDTGKYGPLPAKSLPSALVSAEGKEIIISRQEWKKVVKSLKGKSSRKEFLQKKAAASPAAPAYNPFNQGILAGLLILGLGTGIILLGSLLPTFGTILAWVMGVFVLILGVAFLALTLAGFSVRIIG